MGGIVLAITVGGGRPTFVAPPAPIPGAAPETSTPSIASFNRAPRRQARNPFGLMGWTGTGLAGACATTACGGGVVGGRAGAAGGVGLTDAGGATVRPVATGGVTGRAGAGVAGVAGGAGKGPCIKLRRGNDMGGFFAVAAGPTGAGGGVAAGTLAGIGFGPATGGPSRGVCGLLPLKEYRS